MKTINPYISDLFFNSDVSDAKVVEPGPFGYMGYDMEVLRDHASNFLFCLKQIGVRNLPTNVELAQDFLDRL